MKSLKDYHVIQQQAIEIDRDTIMHLIWEFDPLRYDKLVSEFGADLETQTIRDQLYIEDPDLYICIQDIEAKFINSWVSANEHKALLARFYRGIKMARTQVKITQLDKEILSDKRKKLENKKKRVREILDQENLYNDLTEWTDKQSKEDFKVVNKKSIQSTIGDNEWKWLYHCTGVWQAEDLMIALQNQGIGCAILRSMTIPTDLDMLRYKVISEQKLKKTKR